MNGEEMSAGDGRHGVLRIAGAEGDGLRPGVGAIERLQQHGAVMLSVAAAADGKAGVGVLSQSERRRNDRKTEDGEQHETEKTAHELDNASLRLSAARAK